VPIDPNHPDLRDLATPEYYEVQQILTIFHNKHEICPFKKGTLMIKATVKKV
jgi:hypothetical protein